MTPFTYRNFLTAGVPLATTKADSAPANVLNEHCAVGAKVKTEDDKAIIEKRNHFISSEIPKG